MAKKKERSKVEGSDGTVILNIFSPGHEAKEVKLTIPNIDGSANLLHRSPEAIADAVRAGLRSAFGGRVA